MLNTTSPVQLMQAFDFNSTDLRANRNGLLSSRQQARLRYLFPRSISNHLVVAAMCWLTYMVIMAQVIKSDLPLLGAESIVATLFLMSTAGMLYWVIRRWLRVEQEIKMGGVTAVTGRFALTFCYHVSYAGDRYIIRVEDQELTLSDVEFIALDQRYAYKFYYAPISKVVLSAEMIK